MTQPQVSPPSQFLPEIIDQHLADAEFLLGQWLYATRSPRFNLVSLRKSIEGRLAAHLDALAIGGADVANGKLWPALAPDAAAPMRRRSAVALALLCDPDPATRDRLIDLLRTTASDPVRRALVRAFQVTDRADVDEPLRLALYASETPAAQAALLGVLAARRINPGPILPSLFTSAEPAVLVGALRAAQVVVDRGPLRHLVEPLVTHAAPEVRRAAGRTALIWNIGYAWKACANDARAGSTDAMLYVAILGAPADLAGLALALKSDEHRAGALFALGFTGRVETVDVCLPLLAGGDARAAQLAMEAIAGITGLPLDDAQLASKTDKETVEGELPALAEDPTVDPPELTMSELPRPDAARVRAWWEERRASFTTGVRYLAGVPLSAAAVDKALVEGPLRRAGALACEVAIRSAGRVLLPAPRIGAPAPEIPPDLALTRHPVWY